MRRGSARDDPKVSFRAVGAPEHHLTRIQACASSVGSQSLNSEHGTTSHGADLCIRKAEQRLVSSHLPDQLVQHDDLRRLAVVQLMDNIFDGRR